MDSETVFDLMRQLGFSDYEAKCYLALFERRSLSVNEIAKLSGIPRPSAYDVLEKLLAKGLISAVPGGTKRYAVSSPKMIREVSLDTLDSELKELDRKRDRIISRKDSILENVDTILKELEPVYESNRTSRNPLEYIEILKNPNHMISRHIELLNQTNEEMLGFSKLPFIAPRAETSSAKKAWSLNKRQFQATYDAVNRGVITRNIWDIEAGKKMFSMAQKQNYSDDFKSPGHKKSRISKSLPAKMHIFDRKRVLYFFIDPIKGSQSITALVIEHDDFARSFVDLFEYHWEKSMDYEMDGNRLIIKPFKNNSSNDDNDDVEVYEV